MPELWSFRFVHTIVTVRYGATTLMLRHFRRQHATHVNIRKAYKYNIYRLWYSFTCCIAWHRNTTQHFQCERICLFRLQYTISSSGSNSIGSICCGFVVDMYKCTTNYTANGASGVWALANAKYTGAGGQSSNVISWWLHETAGNN